MFSRTVEMPLIKYEISFQFASSKDCFLVAGSATNQVPELKITDITVYVPVITLSSQDNATLLKQVESGFKRTIILIKYQSKKNKSSAKQIFRFFN